MTMMASMDESFQSTLGQLVDGRGEIVALAGRDYTDDLAAWLSANAAAVRVERPMAGMGIGQQKAWLKRQLAKGGACLV